MTPGLVTGSVLVMLSMVGTTPLPPNPNEGLFTLAQTNGMERRGDRRDTKQDCRAQEGAVGGNKRDCKQEGRQQRNNPAQPATNPAPTPKQ
jgi:hypothetical protein